ncbi:MAG: hypothetical protein FWF94_03490 [Oscillospiraceae bacterium]|nr:hypothetical protein [Oscillospiraceae bacterium]
MLKRASTTPTLTIQAATNEFAPTKTQIDALARRLMPEIKKFFANDNIQKEFAKWQKKQSPIE